MAVKKKILCTVNADGELLIKKGNIDKYIKQICPYHGTRERDYKFCGLWCPRLEIVGKNIKLGCFHAEMDADFELED